MQTIPVLLVPLVSSSLSWNCLSRWDQLPYRSESLSKRLLQSPMSTKNISNDRHVAVLPFPFSSHAGRLHSLVRRLAAAAPTVTFSFYSTSQSIHSLFSPTSEKVPGNVRPYVVPDGVPEGHVVAGGPLDHIHLYLTAVGDGEGLKGELKAAEAETGRRIGCVVSDAFMWFAGDLAEEMGVPWVPLMTGGANSVTAHFYTDLIRETVGMQDIAGREKDIVKFIPGFSEVCLGDLPTGVLYGDLESPFSIMLHKMGRALPKATAIAINSFEELDPDIIQDLKSKFKMVLNISPFSAISLPSSPPPPSSYTDEYGCIPWLDRRKAASVAYVSFGTVATPPPVEIAALAGALEASGTPFLWSLKDNFKKFFPEGFIKRTSEQGKIVPWAPQEQVLAHSSVGVFVTHCGWNSVFESVVAGVPLIGRPFFGDHPLNAWRVENVWKIGLRVEGGVFTKSGTLSALELVLTNEKGKELRTRVDMFKELALKAVGSEGSSTKNLYALLEIVTGYNL